MEESIGNPECIEVLSVGSFSLYDRPYLIRL